MRLGKTGLSVSKGHLPRSSRRHTVDVRNDACLIVNTKGGAHAIVGYHLAKALMTKGHSVTLMNDGAEVKLKGKDPFTQYEDLESAGATVMWGSPTDPKDFPSGSFDVVYDNNGKNLEACQPLIDAYKGKVGHYVFVSSAGAYNANDVEPMHIEGDPRKPSAGHCDVERYLKEQDLPYSIFHPLYIYGPYTAKDCEQWFIDRIIRDRPVPLPEPGVQVTSLSHVEDVASMLACVPGNDAATRQEFNVCGDRCNSFEGIVNAIGEALGKKPKIVYYDPKALGLKKGEGFPFRTAHFFASSDKAKAKLGWIPKHSFATDAKALCDAYTASGRHKADIDFSIDDRILSSLGVPA